MDIKILEESKGKLKIEIVGANHTLCNVLKEELTKDNKVKLASYKIEHPLVSNPEFIIEGDDPKKSMLSSLKKVAKNFSDMEADFKKIK